MKAYEYIITGETPAKKNSRINLKSGISIPSKRFTEWHKDAMRQLINFEKPAEPITETCAIYLEFTHGDLRRRDSDNGCSSIMDLLTDAMILHDDNWSIVSKIVITNKYEKNNAHVVVQIKPE